jgi:hypothetical protein
MGQREESEIDSISPSTLAYVVGAWGVSVLIPLEPDKTTTWPTIIYDPDRKMQESR